VNIRDEAIDLFENVIEKSRHLGNVATPVILTNELLASSVIRRIQAEARAAAFRDFADELDRYIGTSLNAGGAADIARAHANAIEPPATHEKGSSDV
jgi:hypothetical protein